MDSLQKIHNPAHIHTGLYYTSKNVKNHSSVLAPIALQMKKKKTKSNVRDLTYLKRIDFLNPGFFQLLNSISHTPRGVQFHERSSKSITLPVGRICHKDLSRCNPGYYERSPGKGIS